MGYDLQAQRDIDRKARAAMMKLTKRFAEDHETEIADERAKVERETWQTAAAWLEAQADDALDRYGGDLPDTIVIDLAARLRARAKEAD